MIINSFSTQEELAFGEEMLLAVASFFPLDDSMQFSKIKLLDTFAGSGETCSLTKFSFTSGGEGAPVTRPPLTLGFSSQDGLLSELMLSVPLLSGEAGDLEEQEKVGGEIDLEKGKTAATTKKKSKKYKYLKY